MRVADPEAVVRRQSTVTVWPRTAAALPGATQMKLHGVARLPAGVTVTVPGRAVWLGMIQWSTTLKARGWPATTPLTVTVTAVAGTAPSTIANPPTAIHRR